MGNQAEELEEKGKNILDGTIDEYESRPRTLSQRKELVIGILAVTFSLFQLYTSWAGPFVDLVQRSIHIAFAFSLLFATFPPKKKSKKRDQILWTDWILIGASLACSLWVTYSAERMVENPGDSIPIDLVLGIIMVFIVLEGARRVIGPVLPGISLFIILYAWLSPYLPGPWASRGFSLRSIIENLYVSTIGIWGMVTGISASVIAGFLIFGVMLQKLRGGETFVDLALRIAGRSHGGPAKVSCFSSAFFGTISGSAVANVVVDGVFNIPLMKGLGYKKEFAAAVEATTSTGGQIMPPVMGAGAFIMAEILGIPYTRVALGAAIPAILFYAGCYFTIHFEAQRINLKPVPLDMIPSFRRKILPNCLPFVLPVSVLVYCLTIGYSPTLAVLYSILISTGWHLITARDRGTLGERLREIISALDVGGRVIIPVAALCACAQIVIGMLSVTGLGVKLSEFVISMTQGNVFLTLFFSMIIAIILGMGVPTTAAYVLAASVAGPTLAILGANLFSTHLFIFYFAIISAITPPVCAAVYVAAAIAQSNWWKTGWMAVRLGLSGFIVPFMFFYAPTLLLFGNPVYIVINSVTAFTGIVILSAAVVGFFLKPMSLIERLLLAAGAFLLIDPGFFTDILGLAILGIVYGNQKFNFLPFLRRSQKGLKAFGQEP